MDNRKDKLRSIIEEYWNKELPPVIERNIQLKVESDLINDVVGGRRAGKTYLMFYTSCSYISLMIGTYNYINNFMLV